MNKVLLTGANGFTGVHLAAHLEAQGMEVVRCGQKVCAENSGWLEFDLLDSESVERVMAHGPFDAVIHLAAISFVAHGSAEQFYRVNLLGTLRLLDALAAAEWRLRKVILASSANVYGRNARARNAEDLCPSPVNHYGCSKLAMEHLAWGYLDRLPLLITRPFNYTGRGQAEHFAIPKIISHFRRRELEIELGDIEVRREFNDVRAVCEMYARLLESDAIGETINLCTGVGHSLTEVLALMQEIAGYKIQVNVNPDFVRAHELPELCGDPARLIDRVGQVTSYSLRDTLKWMYAA